MSVVMQDTAQCIIKLLFFGYLTLLFFRWLVPPCSYVGFITQVWAHSRTGTHRESQKLVMKFETLELSGLLAHWFKNCFNICLALSLFFSTINLHPFAWNMSLSKLTVEYKGPNKIKISCMQFQIWSISRLGWPETTLEGSINWSKFGLSKQRFIAHYFSFTLTTQPVRKSMF